MAVANAISGTTGSMVVDLEPDANYDELLAILLDGSTGSTPAGINQWGSFLAEVALYQPLDLPKYVDKITKQTGYAQDYLDDAILDIVDPMYPRSEPPTDENRAVAISLLVEVGGDPFASEACFVATRERLYRCLIACLEASSEDDDDHLAIIEQTLRLTGEYFDYDDRSLIEYIKSLLPLDSPVHYEAETIIKALRAAAKK